MRASTELAAAGTWQDPDSVSNDERADNVLLEVQYGDTKDERVGDGIIVALSLINNLEVNEQVLYARMIDVEQTTLDHVIVPCWRACPPPSSSSGPCSPPSRP